MIVNFAISVKDTETDDFVTVEVMRAKNIAEAVKSSRAKYPNQYVKIQNDFNENPLTFGPSCDDETATSVSNMLVMVDYVDFVKTLSEKDQISLMEKFLIMATNRTGGYTKDLGVSQMYDHLGECLYNYNGWHKGTL